MNRKQRRLIEAMKQHTDCYAGWMQILRDYDQERIINAPGRRAIILKARYRAKQRAEAAIRRVRRLLDRARVAKAFRTVQQLNANFEMEGAA